MVDPSDVDEVSSKLVDVELVVELVVELDVDEPCGSSVRGITVDDEDDDDDAGELGASVRGHVELLPPHTSHASYLRVPNGTPAQSRHSTTRLRAVAPTHTSHTL